METNIEALRYPVGKFERPTHFSPEAAAEWIKILRLAPSWMDACIENLDEFQLQTPYRDGGWTIQQVVHHMADSHMNAFIRIKLALTEDNPTIKTYDEQLWAELPDTALVPVNVSVTMLHTIHRRMVALLENMPEGGWVRTFYHPDRDRNIPVWELTALYAWHSRHHTAHIQNLRLKMGW